MEPITLTSRRLLLRPFTAGDTDAVHLACQDPEILRWTEIPSPYLRSDAELFTSTLAPAGWRDDSGYHFALVERYGTLAGALGLVRRPGPGTYEVGYWLARQHRGQGYGTEAVVRSALWAFSVLGAVRLEWWAEAGNVASRGVALRAGFRLDDGQRPEAAGGGTGEAADGTAVAGGERRSFWSASLFPADLGLPASGPGRIPARLGLRLTGSGLPEAGARPPGSAAYLPPPG
ncbi:GNAT family N-acetyltransferase [Streptomyces sp. NPDC008125]|uniref:GNAT family N-acetyltransferase n=1 Tax=Streptomyces sp. NPDC008125 TaxID=3364811 RepID=UPI0036E4E728